MEYTIVNLPLIKCTLIGKENLWNLNVKESRTAKYIYIYFQI